MIDILIFLVIVGVPIIGVLIEASLTPEQRRENARWEYFHKFGKFPEERGSGVTDFLVFCIFAVICGPVILYFACFLYAEYDLNHPTPTVQIPTSTAEAPFKATYAGSDTPSVKYGERLVVEEQEHVDGRIGDCWHSTHQFLIHTTERPAGFVWCGELPDYFRRTQ